MGPRNVLAYIIALVAAVAIYSARDLFPSTSAAVLVGVVLEFIILVFVGGGEGK